MKLLVAMTRMKAWDITCRGKRLLLTLTFLTLTTGVLAEPASSSADVAYGGLSFLPVRYLEWPAPDAVVAGLRLNLIAGRHDAVMGLDIGMVVNYVDSDFRGAGFSLINSYGETCGLQVGLVNATGVGRGVQIGFWNMAEDYRGLQVGVGNLVHRMCGVQVGLCNLIAESPFPTCIIMNACF